MLTQCVFPAEIITYILYHTNPRDIVRWQTVSKWLRTIASDPPLWGTLYANAPFPRPPGPFPSQSTESLQRMLVKSAQLAQSWTTRTMRDLSTTKVHLKGDPSTPPKLISGRWLLSCEEERRFVLYDTYAGASEHARQVLWKKENPVVSSWDMCWMTTAEGRCVVYVALRFSNEYRDWNLLSWQLLEFRLDDRSGELHESAAVDPPDHTSLSPGVELHGGKSPFLYIMATPGRVCVVFDTRTRVFYELPAFGIALYETLREVRLNGISVDYLLAFTETHLISFCHLGAMGGDTVVQVFTLPPDVSPIEEDNPVFRLTHEGVIDSFRVMNDEVLESSVDPATGATTVKLLDPYARNHDAQVTRLDLTLPEPSDVDVLPLTVKLQHIGFPNDGAPETRYQACFQYVDVSDDGQVRGFFRGVPRQVFLEMDNDHMRKFTIDTTQDPWVTACGKLSPADWRHIEDGWIDEDMAFDGMRGKLCFADPRNYKTIVVVDIE